MVMKRVFQVHVLNLTCMDINSASTLATGNDHETGLMAAISLTDIPATSAPHCAITETQPANTTDGKDTAGRLAARLAMTICRSFWSPGEHGTDYDFGEILTNPATISGSVWHDSNHDRTDNERPNQKLAGRLSCITRDNPSVLFKRSYGAGDTNDRCFGQLSVLKGFRLAPMASSSARQLAVTSMLERRVERDNR